MRRTFALLDDLLIERLFQPASNLISHQLGCSYSTSACLCVDVASFSWIVSRGLSLPVGMTSWGTPGPFTELAVLLLGLVAMMSLRMLFHRSAPKQANPLRQSMLSHRAIVLLMLVAHVVQHRVPDLAGMADLAMLVFAIAGLYLGACVEQPPARRVFNVLAPAI